MKRETYQRGLPGVKWGIWNCQRKCFQFSISEDTPMLAEARLYQKIGDDARKWRFEPRQLPGRYAKSATFSPTLFERLKMGYGMIGLNPLKIKVFLMAGHRIFYPSYRRVR